MHLLPRYHLVLLSLHSTRRHILILYRQIIFQFSNIFHDTLILIVFCISHRFIPPPPGWGDWRLLCASNPWASCLSVVTDLTYHVTVQQAALDAHRDVMVQTTTALYVILDAWRTELDLLRQQQAKVTAVANSIEDAHNALEDADYVYVAGVKCLKYLKDNLAHYTRRLRELGLAHN